tara:strand:- start:4276 stop:5262 length:987 start_codon:yes stop_codon:yes gene_type:complete
MRIRKKIDDGLSWLGSRPKTKSGILLYHRVDTDHRDKFNLCVSPENFEDHMSLLAESGRATTLHDLVNNQRLNQLTPSSIAVTFDDGYLDVLEKALPILTKYQIPATVYIVTGNLGSQFWWDKLSHIIHEPKQLPDKLEIRDTDGLKTMINCRGCSRVAIYDSLYQKLRSQSPTNRAEVLAELSETTGYSTAPNAARAITPEELLKLASNPLITIGAHTDTHSRLTSLDYREQQDEIQTSVSKLSGIIGHPIETFSYPFGLKRRDYSEETIKAVKAAGLNHSLAADLGVVTNQSTPFALPRLWIHDRGKSAFNYNLRLWLGSQKRPRS